MRWSIFRASSVSYFIRNIGKGTWWTAKIESRILLETWNWPMPTHQCSLVCPLYSTTSLIVMPDSLYLAGPVLSVKGRGHLVNFSFYHSLALIFFLSLFTTHSDTVSLHGAGNIASWKIKILGNLWCCLNSWFFYTYTFISPVGIAWGFFPLKFTGSNLYLIPYLSQLKHLSKLLKPLQPGCTKVAYG